MVLSLATKVVKAITISKVLIWTLAAMIAAFAFTMYEFRNDVFNAANRAPLPGNPVGHAFIVSEDTKKHLQQIVKNDDRIISVSVFSADIRLNIRKPIYTFTDALQSPQEELLLNNLTQFPLFTNNEENNRQVVKLINGEFYCAPYTTSPFAKAAPNLNRTAISLCRASLPPYYGYFAGFVSILLSEDPDVDRQIRLKSELESLAAEIYFKDVIPTSKKMSF